MNLFIRGIRIGEVTFQAKVVSLTWFLGEFVLCYYCFILPNLWLLLTGCYKWAVIHFLMPTNAVTVLIHSSFMTYQWTFKMSNAMGSTCGAGTAYPSRAL